MKPQNKKLAHLSTLLLVSLLGGGLVYSFFPEISSHFSPPPPPSVTNGTTVAILKELENDVRQKPTDQPTWYVAETQSNILAGDSVYSGEQSTAKIEILSGGTLQLGEKTLVIFDESEGILVPTFANGTVRLFINGQMNIMLSGQMTEFIGAHSEVLIQANLNQSSKVTVERGQIQLGQKNMVTQKSGVQNLTAGVTKEISWNQNKTHYLLPKLESFSSLTLSKIRSQAVHPAEPHASLEQEAPSLPIAQEEEVPPTPTVLPPKMVTAPKITKDNTQHYHTIQLEDVYDKAAKNTLLVRKHTPVINEPVQIKWIGQSPEEATFKLQLSKTESFEKPWLEQKVVGTQTTITQWPPGKTFWRIREDNEPTTTAWSDTGAVTIKPVIGLKAQPLIRAKSQHLMLDPKTNRRPYAELMLSMTDKKEKAYKWIFQASRNKDFTHNPLAKNVSKTILTQKNRLKIPLKETGSYYFRVRAVSETGAISNLSNVAHVVVKKRLPSPPPIQSPTTPTPLLMTEQTIKAPKKLSKSSPPRAPAAEEIAKDIPLEKAPTTLGQFLKKQDFTAFVEKTRDRWSLSISGGTHQTSSNAAMSNLSGGTKDDRINDLSLAIERNDIHSSAKLRYQSQIGNSQKNDIQSRQEATAQYTSWFLASKTIDVPFRLGITGSLQSRTGKNSQVFLENRTIVSGGIALHSRITDRLDFNQDFQIGAWFDNSGQFASNSYLYYRVAPLVDIGLSGQIELYDSGQDQDRQRSSYRDHSTSISSHFRFWF